MFTRAAVLWESPGKWQVEKAGLAECGPRDVQLPIEAAGLCHYDAPFATSDTSSIVKSTGTTPSASDRTAAVVRLEMVTALEEFLKRIPDFGLTEPESVTWTTGHVWGPANVEIRFPQPAQE